MILVQKWKKLAQKFSKPLRSCWSHFCENHCLLYIAKQMPSTEIIFSKQSNQAKRWRHIKAWYALKREFFNFLTKTATTCKLLNRINCLRVSEQLNLLEKYVVSYDLKLILCSNEPSVSNERYNRRQDYLIEIIWWIVW